MFVSFTQGEIESFGMSELRLSNDLLTVLVCDAVTFQLGAHLCRSRIVNLFIGLEQSAHCTYTVHASHLDIHRATWHRRGNASLFYYPVNFVKIYIFNRTDANKYTPIKLSAQSTMGIECHNNIKQFQNLIPRITNRVDK